MKRSQILHGINKRSIATKSSNRYAHFKTYSKKSTENPSLKLPLLFSRGFESQFKNKIAFTDYTGQSFSFGELARKSAYLAKEFSSLVPEPQERIAFLCDRDVSFPTTLGATWWAQHIAIPLSAAHPDSMLESFLQSTSTKLLVTNKKHADRLNRIAKLVGSQLLVVDYDSIKSDEDSNPNTEALTEDPNEWNNTGAVILFTSGTTGNPKGVLLTHENLQAQVENICGAWQISEEDTMLHVLPLHHTHGLIHALLSPMAGGARCHMLEKFDASQTWQALLSSEDHRPTIFTAVPTVFVKLIEEYEKTFAKDQTKVSSVRYTCQKKMRTFFSGSASLPVPIMEKFERLSGHRILERYGMTETGLILCNPLHGERKPGFVGTPLETVQIAVADLSARDVKTTILALGDATEIKIIDEGVTASGDLLVKGPSVFKEYWGNPDATRKEFTEEGWFITGDSVDYYVSNGSFKILGRKSVDIIKSGGYKLSALEIETQLLSLKQVKEVAVLGILDPMWGQKVAALIVWNGNELTVDELRNLAEEKLPYYACPRLIKTVSELPKNHLGKVNKKELVHYFS